ncbi:MAG: response regulator transcription factor [Bacteroidetes bacterium]|nr:response regulator transcription factor [Bacteroidota bacterium]
MDRIKVLIADDIEIVRRGYEIIFSRSGDITICGEAVDGADVLAKYAALRPDIVLLDIMMPPSNGLRICREILDLDENAKVLLNTALFKEEVTSKILASGAKGLILKDADSAELSSAIIQIHQGGEYYSKPVLDLIVRRLLRSNSESFQEYWGSQFTAREISIIQLTSEGLTSAEIGSRLNLSKRTIEVNRSLIIKKMGAKNIVDMIIKSYQIGMLDINKS